MRPYVLVKGTDADIESFEEKVAEALSQGFEFSSDLITQVVPSPTAGNTVLLFQPMVFDEDLNEFDELDEEEVDFDEELLVEED